MKYKRPRVKPSLQQNRNCFT